MSTADIPNNGQDPQPEAPKGSEWMSRRDLLKYGASAAIGATTAEAIRYALSREKQFFDREDMERHLENSLVEWRPAGLILNTEEVRCMDGREDQCCISEPGGNMGATLKDFAAAEHVSGRQLNNGEIDASLGRLLTLNRSARFYMHTDSHAVEHVAHEFHVPVQEARELIRNPGDRMEDVREALINYPGCGHLNGILNRPGQYEGVRPEMLRALMRGFYNRLWNPNPQVSGQVDHRIVRGNHNEKAALILDGDGGELDDTALVQPKVDGSSIFITDLKMQRMSDRRWAQIASDVMHIPSRDLDRTALLAALSDLDAKHLEASRQALAPNHPVFRARIDHRQKKLVLE
ncbi:hypothetical protein EXS70_02990 [Candidatus Peribacteria bacterium]|nr:hypothetical protein [Candidatus Peribacteria bacterium]